jgi:molybdopterin-guanine dinucleotide biosynthesis protein A
MRVAAIALSPGHNFFGHHGRPPGAHPMLPVSRVRCLAGRGLLGDRFLDYRPDYRGQVTFFAEETHAALCRELGHRPVSSALYRRNIVTRGADLAALIGREFTVQGVRFHGTGECQPCHWMDQAIGPGAEAWLRGRGGLRARILTDGELAVDDAPGAGLLLAGGASRRMGRDKASLTFGGRPLADHQAATLAASGAWPLLYACRPEDAHHPPGLRVIRDEFPGAGPLAAMVRAWREEPAAVLTVLAVDVPLVPADLLAELAGTARREGMSILPVREGRPEPLVAAWHRSALPALEAAAARKGSFQEVVVELVAGGRARLHSLDPAGASLLANVNTPSEFARLAAPAAG